MTKRDLFFKWTAYALALIPVMILETAVLSRFPVWGVVPMLMPLAAVMVAVFEGSVAGAGFGLAVGVLCDALYYGSAGGATLGLTLIGMVCGIAAQYMLRQNLVGAFLCCAGSLVAIDMARVVARLFTKKATLPVLLRVAVPEVLWSLVFVVPVYALFHAVYRRVGGTRLK